VGKTSPFYNIARRIFMDDFSEEESKELIATQLKLNGSYYPGVDKYGINKTRWSYKEKTNS
jgi:hypothetical protein